MMLKTSSGVIFVCCFLWTSSVWALEIHLKNGDKITGTIVGEDHTSMMVQTLAAGEVKIDKSFIDLAKTYPSKYGSPQTPPPAPVIWQKNLDLGYTQVGGNSKSQSGQMTASINRKTATDETTAKFNALYSSSDGVMNGKKFYGLLRYAYSFGENLKWYNFYKVEGQQDYFADIEYQFTPSTGVGYWFSNTDDLKTLAEAGIGYQYTEYRVVTTPPDGGQPVLVPRFFVDKRLIGNLHLTEDFTVYSSLEDFRQYRIHSETALINQLTKRWALKLSYIDDFNSIPETGFKKNDYTFATSLVYTF